MRRAAIVALLASVALAPMARAQGAVLPATPGGFVPGQVPYCSTGSGWVPCGTGGTSLPVADNNNAGFIGWPAMAAGTTYTAVQLAGVRAIGMQLSAGGVVTLTSFAGDSMALSYPAAGAYLLPYVPASVAFSGGAAGSLEMLK